MRKCLVCNPKKVTLYREGNGKSSERTFVKGWGGGGGEVLRAAF